MNHLPFTLLAYLLNCISVLIDKFLLVRNNLNPLIYIFYISLFSLIALFFLPLTKPPSVSVLALASISTIFWTLGAYFLYKALAKGIASRVVPIIGTLTPLILLLEALATGTISNLQTLAVILLLSGLILLTINDWRGRISRYELFFEILSALLFAISYLVLRLAYLQENFLTVLVYSRLILIPLAIFILLVPSTRKIVLARQEGVVNLKFLSKSGLLFAIGQFAGGSAELLITFSISLATPALVNSLQGTQYIFLFLASIILGKYHPAIFKEKLSKMAFLAKFIGVIIIAVGLYILSFNLHV